MGQFGSGIFLLVESGNRENAAKNSWIQLSDSEQAMIEANRQCCGWNSTDENPQCRWKDKGPCGARILGKQRESLVGLGAMLSSLAVMELLIFGITSLLISNIKKRKKEKKALEEAKAARRNSKEKEAQPVINSSKFQQNK